MPLPRHTTRHMNDASTRSGRCAPGRRGFSIVELLVVVAIIIVLLGILTVVVSRATRGAQAARTTVLMSSISQGLSQFERDHGYLPPVLGRNGPGQLNTDRDGLELPDPGAPDFLLRLQEWRSVTTLAEFLLGYGDRTQDGFGRVGAGLDGSPGDDEIPTLGFRSPGSDGLWGAWTSPRPNYPANGSLYSRNPGGLINPPPVSPLAAPPLVANNDAIPGRTYGPYIDLKDERLIACITPAGEIFLPGEGGFDPTLPKVIVDYWGQPIIYYRRLHQPRNPRDADLRANLGDVFALRPWEVARGQEADGADDLNPLIGGDTTTTQALKSANFALFSAGPDRAANLAYRIDEDEFNRDNIVEVGQ